MERLEDTAEAIASWKHGEIKDIFGPGQRQLIELLQRWFCGRGSFDAHPWNFMANEQVALLDFGRALQGHFALTQKER